MSLDSFAPQKFEPIRLKSSDLSGFFADLRDRKVVRGGDSDVTTTVRLTDKPFRPTPQKLTPFIGSKASSGASKNNTSVKKKAANSSIKKRIAKPKKQNKGKKKKLEGRLSKVKL